MKYETKRNHAYGKIIKNKQLEYYPEDHIKQEIKGNSLHTMNTLAPFQSLEYNSHFHPKPLYNIPTIFNPMPIYQVKTEKNSDIEKINTDILMKKEPNQA